MRYLVLALALIAAAPAMAGTGVVKSRAVLTAVQAPHKVGANCTAGSWGYTHGFGPSGTPIKRDNCTGAISPDF